MLTQESRHQLADSLPDTPENVIALHALRTGRCRAYTIGQPTHFEAAIIDPSITPGELIAFGTNPVAICDLAFSIPTWSCLEVPEALADTIAALLQFKTGHPPRRELDIFYALTTPAQIIPHPAVRLLSPADADLYATSAPLFGDDPHDAKRNLLEGPLAAAIVNNQIVSAVEANIRTPKHANLTAETLPPHRNQGLCTAAASLAAHAAQSLGRTPVWSAGASNTPSRRIPEKLGFTEVSRWTYLIPRKT